MGFDRERIVRLACEMLADPSVAREVHSPTGDDPFASGAHAASFASSTPEASLVPAPRVLMLVGDFAEDYEVMVPYQALGMLGVDVDVVCPCKACGDTIKTAVHDFLGDQTYAEAPGHRFALTASFAEAVAQPSRYDGLYLAGGRAPEYLRLNKDVLALVRAAFALGLPVAAICHGIQVLTAADVVRGRKLTCYAAVAPEVRAAGVTACSSPRRPGPATRRSWRNLPTCLASESPARPRLERQACLSAPWPSAPHPRFLGRTNPGASHVIRQHSSKRSA